MIFQSFGPFCQIQYAIRVDVVFKSSNKKINTSLSALSHIVGHQQLVFNYFAREYFKYSKYLFANCVNIIILNDLIEFLDQLTK